jgi:hypothetical protein
MKTDRSARRKLMISAIPYRETPLANREILRDKSGRIVGRYQTITRSREMPVAKSLIAVQTNCFGC